ncbi:Cytochrome b6-f complex iron-sulfur subunit 1, cyanelle [Porphyridium purpureum]|uniref:plastoquinol--plastocyanin reductase n=1 Tax=Porphyridium purpureum TaxID=35688 RepID=A0A5J4YM94_PORPP|nr:Cytochrome b6-f complex iron-sulfur subunit 1, cyanelle [Porphyridium purpureum]|eukprot:POR2665..scf244_11
MAFVSGFHGAAVAPQKKAAAVSVKPASLTMAAAADGMVPDMAKRNTMNLLLFGAVATPATIGLGLYAGFFVPPKVGGGSGGVVAKDALGNDVKKAAFTNNKNKGDRELVQGLKGDAYWLIVGEEKGIEYYAINATCTHLGCIVPWNRAENKYMCPCHGSQYNKEGKVIRGPAPLSLALAHTEVDSSDNVLLKPWTETDFRTNTNPWWK